MSQNFADVYGSNPGRIVRIVVLMGVLTALPITFFASDDPALWLGLAVATPLINVFAVLASALVTSTAVDSRRRRQALLGPATFLPFLYCVVAYIVLRACGPFPMSDRILDGGLTFVLVMSLIVGWHRLRRPSR